MVRLGNNIHVCRALRRPILALEANSKIFDEVMNPLLDAELSKTNIVRLVFNLDDDSPIQKKPKLTSSVNKFGYTLLLMQLKIFNVFTSF
jgi:hypothetical protein